MRIDPSPVSRAAPPARPYDGEIPAHGRAGRAALDTSYGARLKELLAQLFGMPNYSRYLEHQRAHHNDEPVMSEREFVRAELDRKYAGGGARCC